MNDPADSVLEGDPTTDGGSRSPLILALIGLGVAILIFLSAAVPVLRDRGDTDEDATEDGTRAPATVATGPDPGEVQPTAVNDRAPVTSTIVVGDPTARAVGDAAGEAAGTDQETGQGGGAVDAVRSTVPVSSAVPVVVDDESTTEASDVPESVAVVQGGKIRLSGAVPDQASMDRIVDLAGEILGPDNVINEYFIASGASDPNLGNVRVDDHVLFEPETARIAPEFEPLLGQALALMTIRPSVTLHVVGHTDDRGTVAYNQDLSERRGEAVVAWLVERGVDADRLTSEGRGELEPIASNDTREGRSLNRRIQVFISNLLADS